MLAILKADFRRLIHSKGFWTMEILLLAKNHLAALRRCGSQLRPPIRPQPSPGRGPVTDSKRQLWLPRLPDFQKT